MVQPWELPVKGVIDFVLEFALTGSDRQLGLIWFDIRLLRLFDVLVLDV